MSRGLAGQTRVPNPSDARIRRNFNALSTDSPFIGENQVIQLNGDGEFTLILLANGGLVNVGGELSILIPATESFLNLSSQGLETDEGELYLFNQAWG